MKVLDILAHLILFHIFASKLVISFTSYRPLIANDKEHGCTLWFFTYMRLTNRCHGRSVSKMFRQPSIIRLASIFFTQIF